MKTFEEAMHVFARPAGKTPEETLDLIADNVPPISDEQEAKQKAYLSMMREIGESEEADVLAEQIMSQMQIGTVCCLKHAIIEAFQFGVRCGIEMEKQ
jgi:hypothetical protein